VKLLIKNFLNGCLVLVPTAATVYVVVVLFEAIDGWLGLPIPGAGLLITVVLITAIGAFASNVVGKRLVGLADRLLAKLPLVKLLYTGLRDFTAALLGDRKTFDRPVVVSIDSQGEQGIKVFGFITRDDLSAFGLTTHVAVYVPQSINFAGQLLLVPRERVRPIEVAPAELLPVIVSGAIAGR
jgi:uncharacterized membrane protein